MFKLFVFAFVLAVASAAPSYELYQPASYSYQSSYVQHPSPVLKTYAAPVVVAPVAPVVKAYHAPIVHPVAPVVPVLKTVPAVYSHQYTYKAPLAYAYAPHYY